MSKINIPPITGGYNLSRINDAFQTIEEHLNDKVLYRDVPEGEPNQMDNDLDMNGKRIYNLPEPQLEHEPARYAEVKEVIEAIPDIQQLRDDVTDVKSRQDAVDGKLEEIEELADRATEAVQELVKYQGIETQYTGDDSTTSFSIGEVDYTPELIVVEINGERVDESAYTLINGEIVFHTAPQDGDSINILVAPEIRTLNDASNVLIETREHGIWLLDDFVQGLPQVTQPSGLEPVGGFASIDLLRGYKGTATLAKANAGNAILQYQRTDSGKPDDGVLVVTGENGATWELQYNGVLDFAWLAKGDGVIDDTAAFLKMASLTSKDTILTADSRAKYKLSGADDIVLKGGVDFNGATLDLRDFAGNLVFDSGIDPVEYDAGSPVLVAIQAGGELSGSTWGAAWNEIRDSFLIIETSQDFYRYRQNIVKRKEYNRVTRYGVMESSLRYPLQSSLITKIWTLPIAKKRTKIGNFTALLGQRAAQIAIRRHTNAVFKGVCYEQHTGRIVNNATLIDLQQCAGVTLEDVDLQWATLQENNQYTYNLSMSNCYDMTVKNVRGYGDGWGATGSNSCQRVEFEGCTLSRIDFHEPFREYLKVNKSIIGSWGILVTALGDLIVDDVTFNIHTNQNVNNSGVIRSRADTGGFCDGDLVMSNIRVNTSGQRDLIVHQSASGNAKPENSPITYSFWRDVSIDGLKGSPIQQLFPLPVSGSGVACCRNFSLRRIRGRHRVRAWLAGQRPYLTAATNAAGRQQNNLWLDISDSHVGVSITDNQASPAFKVFANINGMRRDYAAGDHAELELTASGFVYVSGSELSGIDFYSGGYATLPLKVVVEGSVIDKNGSSANTLIDGVMGNVDLSIKNSKLVAASGSQMNTALQAALEGNIYTLGEGVEAYTYDVLSSITIDTAQSVPLRLSTRGKYFLAIGYGADNTYQEIEITLPTVGTTTRTVNLGGGHTVKMTYDATANTILFFERSAGAPALRRLFVS